MSSNAQARSRMGNAAIVVTLVTFLVSNINAQDNLNDTYQDDQCSIGNVQFLLTSWQFWPLDGVLMIASKVEFYILKNHENSWNFVYIHTPEHLFTFVSWFQLFVYICQLVILTRFFTEKYKSWRHLAGILGTIQTKITLLL